MKYDTIKTTLTIETHLFMKHTYFEMKALLFSFVTEVSFAQTPL